MFGDLDWPISASRGFVSISWASCIFWRGSTILDHEQTNDYATTRALDTVLQIFQQRFPGIPVPKNKMPGFSRNQIKHIQRLPGATFARITVLQHYKQYITHDVAQLTTAVNVLNWSRDNLFNICTMTAQVLLFTARTLLAQRQACQRLVVGLVVVTIWLELCTSYSSSCHHLPPPSSLVPIKIQTGDILVPADPGPLGQMATGLR